MTIDNLLDELGITPGKWEDGSFVTEFGPMFGVLSSNVKSVSLCGKIYENDARESLANAKLIAQSREMLKALIRSCIDLDNGWLIDETNWFTVGICNIIESATGKSWQYIKDRLEDV